MKGPQLTIVAIIIGATSLFATDRFFSNCKGRSPNRRYEAKATSPANHLWKRKTPFQKDFTVTFRDTKNWKTVWSWKQGEDDGSPTELIPTDDGRLIMLDAYDNYQVFDTTGVRAFDFSPCWLLPEEEKRKFTIWTSAGLLWSEYSQRGFITLGGKTYFYIRLYWGRTFILDVIAAKLTTEPEIAKQIEQRVVQKTNDLIRDFHGEYYAKCDSCGGKHLRADLTDAVFVINLHNVVEGTNLVAEVLKRAAADNGNHRLKRYLDLMASKETP